MDFLASLENSAFGEWVRLSPSLWAYPGILTLHTVGLAILVGANAIVDLRLLGVGSGLPLARLDAFFSAMWLGFVVNALSGVVLFISQATLRATQPIFLAKLSIIAVAVGVAVVMRRMIREAAGTGVLAERAQLLAVASLLLWSAAIATGRFMAYLNNEPPPLL